MFRVKDRGKGCMYVRGSIWFIRLIQPTIHKSSLKLVFTKDKIELVWFTFLRSLLLSDSLPSESLSVKNVINRVYNCTVITTIPWSKKFYRHWLLTCLIGQSPEPHPREFPYVDRTTQFFYRRICSTPLRVVDRGHPTPRYSSHPLYWTVPLTTF